LYFEKPVQATNKNTSQNAKAQATYTGTIAKFINSFILNFFSKPLHSHHFLKKNKSQNKGENIAYTQSITHLTNNASAKAIIRSI
jgi:hypothetical protein